MSEEKHIEVKVSWPLCLKLQNTGEYLARKKRRNNITDLTLNVPPGHLLISVL